MNQLTCGCEYVDSLILSFCDLHRHPGPESHKDGKGIIIRDLEAQVKEATLDERERCAEIADAHHLEQQGLAPGETCCGPYVARRIREGNLENIQKGRP